LQNITKKLVLLNGPPRCGKDTAAGIISDIMNTKARIKVAENLKFSAPLKESLPVFFGLSTKQVEFLEQHKEEPHEWLLGFSWRQVQIDMSEKYAKLIFGQDVFGRIAQNKLRNSTSEWFFVSDSGFVQEARALVDVVGVDNSLLVRIIRTGTDFSKDSRSYWENSLGIKELQIENNGTVLDYIDTLTKEIYATFGIQ